MLTGPKWRVAMYIDQRATAEQSDAITKIFSGQSGWFSSECKVIDRGNIGYQAVYD